MRTGVLILLGMSALTLVTRTAATPAVTLLPTPGNGLQPQAVDDARGTLHVLYFKGDPAAGDLYYVHRAFGATVFDPPIRVNSEPGTAIATGSVRGGHLALGRGGWIHVAWDASHPVGQPGATYTPMYYTRLSPTEHAFEPQRAIGHTVYLDGGTLAADSNGHVYLLWHAKGSTEGEEHRAVYLAASSDNGEHFDTERPIVEEGGVCACCAVGAFVDRSNALDILYRAAADGIHRDATWAVAGPDGVIHSQRLGAWELNACPMTTFAFAEGPSGLLGAWQTAHQIYFASLDSVHMTHGTVQALAGEGTRSHPSVAINSRGERLIAWTDGTAWARGGTLAWELQDASGARVEAKENAAPVPVWGLVSAVATSDGAFVILY